MNGNVFYRDYFEEEDWSMSNNTRGYTIAIQKKHGGIVQLKSGGLSNIYFWLSLSLFVVELSEIYTNSSIVLDKLSFEYPNMQANLICNFKRKKIASPLASLKTIIFSLTFLNQIEVLSNDLFIAIIKSSVLNIYSME